MSSMKEFLAARKQRTATQPVLAPLETPLPAQTPAPPVADAAKKPAVKKPAKAPDEVLAYACGHKIGRKHLEGQQCASCLKTARVARIQGRAQQRGEQRDTSGRLPDAANFAVVYDASALAWTGTLTVGEMCFVNTASSVFKLLAKLDGMYRVALTRGATGHTAPAQCVEREASNG